MGSNSMLFLRGPLSWLSLFLAPRLLLSALKFGVWSVLVSYNVSIYVGVVCIELRHDSGYNSCYGGFELVESICRIGVSLVCWLFLWDDIFLLYDDKQSCK